jgi:hypothetical protein
MSHDVCDHITNSTSGACGCGSATIKAACLTRLCLPCHAVHLSNQKNGRLLEECTPGQGAQEGLQGNNSLVSKMTGNMMRGTCTPALCQPYVHNMHTHMPGCAANLWCVGSTQGRVQSSTEAAGRWARHSHDAVANDVGTAGMQTTAAHHHCCTGIVVLAECCEQHRSKGSTCAGTAMASAGFPVSQLLHALAITLSSLSGILGLPQTLGKTHIYPPQHRPCSVHQLVLRVRCKTLAPGDEQRHAWCLRRPTGCGCCWGKM